MNTDPIADLLTRIRNAVKARHERTTSPFSKQKVAILEVLKKHRYISDFKVEGSGAQAQVVIELNPEKVSLHLKRVSKPGQRIYVKKDQIKPVLSGYGIGVISTPRGVMTTSEAVKGKLGGELLCEIW